MRYVAEIWKINAVLDLVRHAGANAFRIPGLNDVGSKTYRYISTLGLTRRDVFEVISGLSYRDYVQGPLPDDKGRPSDLWVFGCFIERIETYVKLVVMVRGGLCRAICVSFHEAERAMLYPYRSVA